MQGANAKNGDNNSSHRNVDSKHAGFRVLLVLVVSTSQAVLAYHHTSIDMGKYLLGSTSKGNVNDDVYTIIR